MMRALSLGAGLIALVSLQACSDTVAPVKAGDVCDRDGACEVSGVDLVIDAFELAFSASHPVDSAGRKYVQAYDSVPVRYRIRNRGDQISRAGEAWLMSCNGCSGLHARGIAVRALAPGEVDSGNAYIRPASGAQSQTVRPRLNLDFTGGLDEPFYRNNDRVTTDPYMVVVPTFDGSIQISTPELRFGDRLLFTVTLRNSSAYAILRDTTVAFCFRRREYYGLDSCDGGFGKLPVPQLGPGGVWTGSVDLTLAHAMSGYEKHAAHSVRLDACLGGRTSYVTEPCAAGADITLLPDLESACVVPAIPFGVVQRGDFVDACLGGSRRFRVWRFEGKAGVTYTASASTIPSTYDYELLTGIWDRNGNLIGSSGDGTATATPSADGRYYLVIRSGAVGPTLAFETNLNESAR